MEPRRRRLLYQSTCKPVSDVCIAVRPFDGFPFDFAHRFPRAYLLDTLPGKRLLSIAEKDLRFELADDTFGHGPRQWS